MQQKKKIFLNINIKYDIYHNKRALEFKKKMNYVIMN